ncbi:glycosyltransferase family 4 protein [Spongiibacter sp. KMU-166]|uniref:Glycosyltransferase family 4 protein n=1 Tax=Spongiibacter thalassae TaxID=2721624 RepID=A0ABX1GKV8_9GAMM|nr:glycosyltransferase family 4 protein [Spongiibacter thalassae]NKI19561.1 glycosyltransferase family 4 protein [Spongiibacter thalassae]
MPPKKLLFIAWDLDFKKGAALVGGMVKNPYYLLKGISKNFETKYLSTSKNRDFFSHNVRERVDTNYLAALPKYLIRCLIISLKISRSYEKPDILHVHTPALVPIFYSFKNTALVVTAHGTHWPEFKANHRVRGLKSLVIYINAYLQFMLERKIYAMADRVISVSDFQVKELVDDYRVRPEKIEVIQNGIDMCFYAPPELSVVRDTDVLFVGRPVPKKGIDVLLEAIKIANKELPSPIESTWVFGQGWVSEPNVGNQYAEAIQNIGGRILNHVPEEDLPSLYGKAKVLVVPSLGYESLPTVLMEGVACGVVPLASKSFGNVELLPAELLFEEGNVKELAKQIVSVLTNISVSQKMAATVDLEKYKLERCVAEHEKLYMRVCNEQ